MTVAVSTNPRNIDPRLQWDSSSQMPLSNIVDRFFTIDEDFNYRPLLAESWSYNDEGTEYTFHLREGVKFHDGTEVTAEAIKENIVWTKAQEAFPQATFWQVVEAIETPDEYTVVMKLNRPMAPSSFLAERMDSPWPISLEQLKANGDEGVTDPIGAGPFKFVSYTGDDQIVMERFDDYWAGAPYLDRVTFRVIPDASSRRIEMEAGTVDLLLEVEPKDVASYEDAGMKIVNGPAPSAAMVTFNLANEPLDDVRVRSAIAYALDRDALIDRILYGYATKAQTYLPADNIYFDPDVPGFTHDVEKAKQLLDEAGWHAGPDGIRMKDGARLHLNIANRNHETWTLMSQIMADQLGEIGIETTISTTDTTAFHDAVLSGGYDIAFWKLESPSWEVLGDPNLHSEDWGNISHMTESTPEVQALQRSIDEAMAGFEGSLDEEARSAYAGELQEIINENMVIVPLWFEDRIYVMQPYVKGVEAPTVMRSVRLENAWLDK